MQFLSMIHGFADFSHEKWSKIEGFGQKRPDPRALMSPDPRGEKTLNRTLKMIIDHFRSHESLRCN